MNLAVVGSGMIVNDFFRMVGDLPDIRVKAIVGTERSRDKLIALQAEHGIDDIYTNYTMCLENAGIDTVYIAVPNSLHYTMSKEAIAHGKNVICEKPFTMRADEARKLAELAIEKGVILLEAITNQYLPNYQAIKENLTQIGNVRIVQMNFSQYSSRYKAFCEGIIMPVFDPKKGGGALMDIHIYNIHFAVGLFGRPEKVKYYANMERGVDTSGILMMEYPGMQVVSIGAKDSNADSFVSIQGDEGTITIPGTTNALEKGLRIWHTSGKEEVISRNIHKHRMYNEFEQFTKVIETQDQEYAKERLRHSIAVMDVVEMAHESGDGARGAML